MTLALHTPRPVEYTNAHRLFTKAMLSIVLLVFSLPFVLLAVNKPAYLVLDYVNVTIQATILPAMQLGLALLTASLIKKSSAAGDEDDDAAGMEGGRLRFKHVTVLPNYKEPEELLQTTLGRLASHRHARSSYIVVLAMEQRERGWEHKAERLRAAFEGRFADIVITAHPSDMDDYPGKGSNVGWAARQAKFWLVDGDGRSGSRRYALDDLVLSVIDSDALMHEGHYAYVDRRLAELYADRMPNAWFCVANLFAQNEKHVPTMVRISDIGFSLGQLSSFILGSPVGNPLSNYSLPMRLAHEMGYWDTGSEGVGEDLHSWLRAFFYCNGALLSELSPYPATLANIEAPEDKYVPNLRARYTQAVRHLLGLCDLGMIWLEVIRRGRSMPVMPTFRLLLNMFVAMIYLFLAFAMFSTHQLFDVPRVPHTISMAVHITNLLLCYTALFTYRRFHNSWVTTEHRTSVVDMLYMIALLPFVYIFYAIVPGLVALFSILFRADIPVLPRADKSPSTSKISLNSDDKPKATLPHRRLWGASSKRGGRNDGKAWPRWALYLSGWRENVAPI